jgi:4-hydroxy-tetrahydrodipicolinate reductase
MKNQNIKAVVAGACGRMGTAVIETLRAAEGIELVGALELREHPCVGQVAGDRPGADAGEIRIASTHESLPAKFDVFIDFTAPAGTLDNLEFCARTGTPSVIGTTGFTDKQREALTGYAGTVPIVFSPNMSIGVNLLFKLAGIAAASLGNTYDAEIVEVHHKLKKDAPSGTALRLAETVAGAFGRDLDENAVYSRHGMIGDRSELEIGIQAVRAGDIVGEHTLLFAGPGERIELTHRAHSRDNFARGAIRAALWVVGRKPGLYSMADVLGL